MEIEDYIFGEDVFVGEWWYSEPCTRCVAGESGPFMCTRCDGTGWITERA